MYCAFIHDLVENFLYLLKDCLYVIEVFHYVFPYKNFISI